MGANPETFEKKARSASSTADSPPERHLIATAEGDVESFSPRSPPTLRYYAARMTSRLNQAPLDIVWLMLCRMVKLCVIVPGSGSFSLILTVIGDAEGTIVELMGFPTFIGAYMSEWCLRQWTARVRIPTSGQAVCWTFHGHFFLRCADKGSLSTLWVAFAKTKWSCRSSGMWLACWPSWSSFLLKASHASNTLQSWGLQQVGLSWPWMASSPAESSHQRFWISVWKLLSFQRGAWISGAVKLLSAMLYVDMLTTAGDWARLASSLPAMTWISTWHGCGMDRQQ